MGSGCQGGGSGGRERPAVVGWRRNSPATKGWEPRRRRSSAVDDASATGSRCPSGDENLEPRRRLGGAQAVCVSQHMTGDLHLLTDFVTVRPSHTVQTHTGARLQVCGEGSVKTGLFNIPNVSYVPGLSENIISVSQRTDTGFTVIFGADGFTVEKRADETKVGSGSYGGNQLFHLDSLVIPISK
uniref:Retrovirus-related Pol polyprotein from transposon TNT 1-94-like beta-barrel domain-containing protein n=1 Tax=Setaria viridis TaxID=4556 RepID=A0A4U6VF68_SETVI|nr:hypothetical protein SEVIR_3G297700v2 [Setaria viridis]